MIFGKDLHKFDLGKFLSLKLFGAGDLGKTSVLKSVLNMPNAAIGHVGQKNLSIPNWEFWSLLGFQQIFSYIYLT